MGGKALNLPRLSRQRYQELGRELVSILELSFKEVLLPRTLPSKESFGDIDILAFGKYKDFEPQTTQKKKNRNVLSFEFCGYQVDIIEYGIYNDFLFYHDYGDLSIIIGMILKRLGIRLNQRGLSLILQLGSFMSIVNQVISNADLYVMKKEEIEMKVKSIYFHYVT